MKDIAIYGAGGFGREVACMIQRINAVQPEWNMIGFFVDYPEMKGKDVSHFGKCLGGIEELNRWEGELAVVLAMGDAGNVRKVYQKITNPNVWFPNLIDPIFLIEDPETFTIGKGNIIQGGCSFSCDVSIGDFNIFIGCVNIGHDAKIGSFNNFMTAVKISGNVRIGQDNYFGVGSIIIPKIEIGQGVRLGAGSVLMTRPKDGCLYLGVPAMMMQY